MARKCLTAVRSCCAAARRSFHALREAAVASVAAVVATVTAGVLLVAPALAGGHSAVSADAAARALAQGAMVVDVRSPNAFAAGHVPGAVRLPVEAAALNLAELERMLSATGVDLSRTVLVVGEPGDANAQALWATLQTYATGRVLWLVGGTTEWQMTGRTLNTDVVATKAVPQRLVALHPAPAGVRMAGHSVREAGVPRADAIAALR
jgi:rhodanese-related sulfurtransferase